MKNLEPVSNGRRSLKFRKVNTLSSTRKIESHSPVGSSGCLFGHLQPLKGMPDLNPSSEQSSAPAGVVASVMAPPHLPTQMWDLLHRRPKGALP